VIYSDDNFAVRVMLEFKTEQKRFDIGGVEVGGLPGESPTVLVGTIFYSKQKIVKDERAGEFDREEAEKIINTQQEFSEKTGLPCMIDVVGATPQALRKSIDFVAEISNAPMLLDGISASVRIDALKHVEEVGLTDRVIYNTITPEYRDEELVALKNFGLESVILLTYTPRDLTSRGRIKAARDLIPKLREVGAEKILIDTCTLDIPSLGSSCGAIFDLKSELGYPTGCGAHNAVSTWRGLKGKMGLQARESCVASSAVMAVAFGADFVLYGPIEDAPYVFPSVALADSALAQLTIEKGRMPTVGHPIFKIP